MEIFIIDKIKTKEIYHQMLDFVDARQKIGIQRDSAVVIGGE